MKYKIGQIVYHNLTNEKFLIISLHPQKRYECRNKEYTVFCFKEEEIRPENGTNI